MTKPYQTHSSQTLISNPWYSLRQDKIILPNGETGIYNVINKADAVWVVPVLTDGRVVLINQYRYPIDAWCLEVPAGGIPPDADPEKIAAQELLEEVGGMAERLQFLGKFWTMNGIGDEMAYMYIAQGVRLGQVQHEATEIIELQIVDGAQALDMARRGLIADGPSALAILLCAEYLR